MKKLVFISFMLITVLSMSCSSIMSSAENPENSLMGKWKLTESLSDPGDGSGKWQKASSKNMYLIFNNDGTVSGDQAGTLKSYTVLDSTKIEFTQQSNTKITYRYKITSGELTLNPPCIEACGSRYRKVD